MFSSNDLDEPIQVTKRSSTNHHRIHGNSTATSIGYDKERAFSSCKYSIDRLFFLDDFYFTNFSISRST